MSKVLLVEDDNNLREIYEARLAAEGYQTVSAHDGEEALALAVKERPDLIISDVMMPKISGFDMLDILRSTPETKNCKVIMMTALGQAEDRARADKLGADRYLVKSQVTLEDVIKVAHEVLDDTPAAPTDAQPVVTPANPQPAASSPVSPSATDDDAATPPAVPVVAAPALATPPEEPAATSPTSTTTPAADDTTPTTVTPAVTPVDTPPASTPAADLGQSEASATDAAEKQIQDFISNNPGLSATPSTPASDTTTTVSSAPPVPTSTSIPVTDVSTNDSTTSTVDPTKPSSTASSIPVTEQPPSNVPEPPSHKKLVLQPTENATQPAVDLNALLEKENAKGDDSVQPPAANTIITPQTTSDTASTTPSPANPNDIAL